MINLTRRRFLASLAASIAALPFSLKTFTQPSRAAVAEFQSVCPPALPIGGTYTITVNGKTSGPIPFNATHEEYRKVYDSLWK